MHLVLTLRPLILRLIDDQYRRQLAVGHRGRRVALGRIRLGVHSFRNGRRLRPKFRATLLHESW